MTAVSYVPPLFILIPVVKIQASEISLPAHTTALLGFHVVEGLLVLPVPTSSISFPLSAGGEALLPLFLVGEYFLPVFLVVIPVVL